MRRRQRFILLTGVISLCFFLNPLEAAEPLTGALKPNPEMAEKLPARNPSDRQKQWQNQKTEIIQNQNQDQFRTHRSRTPSSNEIRLHDRDAWRSTNNFHQWQQHPPVYHQPGFHFYREMPYGHKSFFLGGTHYFFYDDLWYVLRNDMYEEAPAPRGVIIINGEPILDSEPILSPTPTLTPEPDDVTQPDGDMQVIDFNGLRYYYKDGRYYRRDINGNYLEVPPPR